jgi:hypothetical protein
MELKPFWFDFQGNIQAAVMDAKHGCLAAFEGVTLSRRCSTYVSVKAIFLSVANIALA